MSEVSESDKTAQKHLNYAIATYGKDYLSPFSSWKGYSNGDEAGRMCHWYDSACESWNEWQNLHSQMHQLVQTLRGETVDTDS